VPENHGTTFDQNDRKELIRHSLLLDQISRDIAQMSKTLEKELKEVDIFRDDHERRLRSLEDFRIELKSTIRTTLWGVSILSVGLGAVTQFVFKSLGLL
jgi:hypothetical protein